MAVKKQINYQGISTLEVLEGANNYNKWIAEEILKHTKSPVIEVGAGIGNISSYFTSHSITLTDNDDGLVNELKIRFKKYKKCRVLKLDITKKNGNFKNYKTLFGVNVLEHVKDDVLALRNMNRILSREGRLILLVPAKKSAFTRLDKELGHFRRYEKKELEEKLQVTGFKIEKLYFFNIVGLISWVVRDKIKRKNSALAPYQIAIFDRIVPLLKVIESRVKIPTGISLIAIAKKSESK